MGGCGPTDDGEEIMKKKLARIALLIYIVSIVGCVRPIPSKIIVGEKIFEPNHDTRYLDCNMGIATGNYGLCYWRKDHIEDRYTLELRYEYDEVQKDELFFIYVDKGIYDKYEVGDEYHEAP